MLASIGGFPPRSPNLVWWGERMSIRSKALSVSLFSVIHSRLQVWKLFRLRSFFLGLGLMNARARIFIL